MGPPQGASLVHEKNSSQLPEQKTPTPRVVIAPVIIAREIALTIYGASEFIAPDHERILDKDIDHEIVERVERR